MKKLTLDQTWKLCLSMWRWIARQWKLGRRNVGALKDEWLRKHGYAKCEVSHDCFFCEYVKSHNVLCDEHCPGTKVDEEFRCDHPDYKYDKKPIAFYNKLVSLKRKRMKTKSMSRK